MLPAQPGALQAAQPMQSAQLSGAGFCDPSVGAPQSAHCTHPSSAATAQPVPAGAPPPLHPFITPVKDMGTGHSKTLALTSRMHAPHVSQVSPHARANLVLLRAWTFAAIESTEHMP